MGKLQYKNSTNQENSDEICQIRLIHGLLRELELETEYNITGEDSEFNNEPNVGVEVVKPNNRIRPPKMIALDSTPESITWKLSELDPKIRIDKYQVN